MGAPREEDGDERLESALDDCLSDDEEAFEEQIMIAGVVRRGCVDRRDGRQEEE
jgi:hypothetical protein